MYATKTLLKTAAIAAMIALSAGCATTSDLEQVKQMAADAQKSADAAKASADQAMQTANEAKASADKANSCCQDTNEKIDRMFKKTMRK